ncbi:MAG: hypothetical protein AAFV37_07075, partial [Pseudomonadota bacterium]
MTQKKTKVIAAQGPFGYICLCASNQPVNTIKAGLANSDGYEAKGAQRWIRVGSFGLQPSE